MALARTDVLEDLKGARAKVEIVQPGLALKPNIPQALQRADWVSNPAWAEQPWQTVTDNAGLKAFGSADLTGIGAIVATLSNEVAALGNLAAPPATTITLVDQSTMTSGSLASTFPEIENAAAAGH